MKKIKGIIPPMVTPLLEDDKLDIKGTGRLVEHILSGGVHGLFLLGTTGEGPGLSHSLRQSFIKEVTGMVAGRVPVLVGITDTSFQESLSMARVAADCGADGVVAAPPYYFAVSKSELSDYYRALADSSPLPLYLYNIPSRVKTSLDVDTIKALADHPNIVGFKDSSADMLYFQTILHHLKGREDFAVYVGPEENTAECVLMGADGGINGGANVFPHLFVKMYDAAVGRDFETIDKLQKMIMTISSTLYSIGDDGPSFLKSVKCALSMMGICSDYVCLPCHRISPSERKKVQAALEELSSVFFNNRFF